MSRRSIESPVGPKAASSHGRGSSIWMCASAFALASLAVVAEEPVRKDSSGTVPSRKPALAILKLETKGDARPSLAAMLDDVLSAEVFQSRAYDLVNRDQIDQVMKEFKLQRSGLCDSMRCYAEMGGAIGAEKMLVGSVSKVKDTFLIHIKLIDITLIKDEFVDALPCAGCQEEQLLDVIRELVGRMLGRPVSAPPGLRPLERPVGGAAPLSAEELGFEWPRVGSVRGSDGAPMVLIEAGEFQMGGPHSDERPLHRVVLRAYDIDRFEVTAGQYRKFLEAITKIGHGFCDRNEPDLKDHAPASWIWKAKGWSGGQEPVVGVDWWDAAAYCAWAGKRLPTEAEWEKAARGTGDAVYPWGASWDRARANSSRGGPGRTEPVGAHESGRSFYGVEDMSGNVAEWVMDYYSKDYYSKSPLAYPRGPSTGSSRVIRGGSWYDGPDKLRAAARNAATPALRNSGVGFRCAQDVP